MIATLTVKGQLTLPKPVRERLDLHAGDKLDFILKDDGLLEVVPLKQPPSKLRGMLPKPSKAVSVAQMNKAIVKGAQRYDRD